MMKNTSTPDNATDEASEKENLKALVDNTDDLIWSVDKDFKVITSNRAFKEKVRLSSKETINQGSEALASDIRSVAYYERALSGEAFKVIEYSDDPVWLEISFCPIRKGDQVMGVACCSRDITLTKREDHHLRLLESVVTNATDAVLITDACPLEAGQRIVYVNDALINMTGYAREELLGKTPRILQGPKSDMDQLGRAIKCLAQSRPCEIEIVNYKKNGDEFWMHIAIVPIVDGSGQPVHFISIGRDITERFANAEAIREQNKKLKDIAWVQSHDVRGPLARIKGLVNLLDKKSHSKADTEIIDYLRISSNEMDDVIKNIINQTEKIYGFNPSENPKVD